MRAAVFTYREEARASASLAGGLARWLAAEPSAVSVEYTVYRVVEPGLLVQRLPDPEASAWWRPKLRLIRVGERLCSYREGVWTGTGTVRYCTLRASGLQGYCKVHENSPKALYELCAQGVDAACKKAEELVGDETFSVYILDYGGQKLKVGLTQSWRLLWRVAEQPHVAAAEIFQGRLTEARNLERRLGRGKVATEGAGIRIRERLNLSVARLREYSGAVERAAYRLAELAARLGLRGTLRSFTVLPRTGLDWVTSVRLARSLDELLGLNLELVDYWGGLLLFRVDSDGVVAVRKDELLHREIELVPLGGSRGSAQP
ncbi:MAG: hypothetical protein ABWW70_03440 [Thermoproteota archaeon]